MDSDTPPELGLPRRRSCLSPRPSSVRESFALGAGGSDVRVAARRANPLRACETGVWPGEDASSEYFMIDTAAFASYRHHRRTLAPRAALGVSAPLLPSEPLGCLHARRCLQCVYSLVSSPPPRFSSSAQKTAQQRYPCIRSPKAKCACARRPSRMPAA